MSEIHGPVETTAVAIFCPKCGSPTVTSKFNYLGPPMNEPFVCESCSWTGLRRELIVSKFKHEFDSDATMQQAVVNDLKDALAKDVGQTFIVFLEKWGFISQPFDSKEIARYLKAIAVGTLSAIVLERAKIEKETRRGRNQR